MMHLWRHAFDFCSRQDTFLIIDFYHIYLTRASVVCLKLIDVMTHQRDHIYGLRDLSTEIQSIILNAGRVNPRIKNNLKHTHTPTQQTVHQQVPIYG